MKILVVGGTQFLGRAIVVAAVAAGHEVTLFNRGKTGTELFPNLEKLKGDRNTGDYTALQGRSFDAVIDVCAYYPRAIHELLAAVETDHFTLISTISVYASNEQVGQDESAERLTLTDPTTEEITGETYGGLKVLCEQAATELLPERVLIVRSGLIMGAHDNTQRFPYWTQRIAQGGRMIVPPALDDAIQMIDARDEAEWTIAKVEQALTGIFNVTGTRDLTFRAVFETIKAISGSDAEFVSVSSEFMQANAIEVWQDLPLWILAIGDMAGFHTYSTAAAVAEGLSFRPISETVHEMLAWQKTLPDDYEFKVGLSAEREHQLLTLWDKTPKPTN